MPMTPPPKKLLDQVRDVMRLKHYSFRTEEAYLNWVKRYIVLTTTPFPSHRLGGAPGVIYTHVLQRGGLAVRSPLD